MMIARAVGSLDHVATAWLLTNREIPPLITVGMAPRIRGGVKGGCFPLTHHRAVLLTICEGGDWQEKSI